MGGAILSKSLIQFSVRGWSCVPSLLFDLRLNYGGGNKDNAKRHAKECSNYHTIALISHASKVMLKILQARLPQYVNCELPDVQDGFRKGRGTRDQIANICWIIKKTREFQKNIYFCLLTMPKPLTVWITINCGKL